MAAKMSIAAALSSPVVVQVGEEPAAAALPPAPTGRPADSEKTTRTYGLAVRVCAEQECSGLPGRVQHCSIDGACRSAQVVQPAPVRMSSKVTCWSRRSNAEVPVCRARVTDGAHGRHDGGRVAGARAGRTAVSAACSSVIR